jgi:hypothetical protein
LCNVLFTSSLQAEELQAKPGITVELLEPGNAPLREVRFKPAVGSKQTAEMIMKMNQVVSVGGNKMPSQSIPPQKMVIEIVVTDIADNGDISFDFTYTDVQVIDDPNNPSPIAKTIEDMLKPLIGAKGRGIVSDCGITRKGEFDIPAGLNPAIKQMLEGMKDSMNRLSSPVPSEPIGTGAKWEVIQEIEANGMKLTQTSTHEIETMDEKGFQIKIDVSQQADPQEIQNPALPAGTTLKLDDLQTSGGGRSTVIESSIFPESSEVAIETTVDMSINVANQVQKMQTAVTMEIQLNPVAE